jgi:ABC-2 type transport system permease protein
MKPLQAAIWAETLKARRSKLPWLTAAGFSLAPLMGGLFMIILKDPVAARSMGLISAKAQLTAGVADWPTYFGMLAQAAAIGGALLFALVTAWVFGREFSERTVKELLALPTPRGAIVSAKFLVVALFTLFLAVWIFAIGLVVGSAVGLPGWSIQLLWSSAARLMITAALTILLMPAVAFFACAGRGYLPAIGWAFLTLFFAQIVAATGWGAWFPWSVPALYSDIAGPRSLQIGTQSYILVILTAIISLAVTYIWWNRADQTQ